MSQLWDRIFSKDKITLWVWYPLSMARESDPPFRDKVQNTLNRGGQHPRKGRAS